MQLFFVDYALTCSIQFEPILFHVFEVMVMKTMLTKLISQTSNGFMTCSLKKSALVCILEYVNNYDNKNFYYKLNLKTFVFNKVNQVSLMRDFPGFSILGMTFPEEARYKIQHFLIGQETVEWNRSSFTLSSFLPAFLFSCLPIFFLLFCLPLFLGIAFVEQLKGNMLHMF